MLEGEALRRSLKGENAPTLEPGYPAGDHCCKCGAEQDTCVRGMKINMTNGTMSEMHRHYCEPCLNADLESEEIHNALPGEQDYIKPAGGIC